MFDVVPPRVPSVDQSCFCLDCVTSSSISLHRSKVGSICAAEAVKSLQQPVLVREEPAGQTGGETDSLLVIKLRFYFFPADERHCSVWSSSASPHSLRLSSVILPPSPLSSPDCQAVTEEEDEDFYHEDSALVIKEETGPEAGPVLSLPEPAFSPPCKF